jgi:hypothetical protein
MERIDHGRAKKNLQDAARHFLNSGKPDETERLKQEAAGLGLPADAVAELIGPQAPRVFLVWPQNWDAVMMFNRLQTQWRNGPRGPSGLDYGAAQWLFSLCAVTQPFTLLEDLQVMENAYLTELYS